MNTAKEPGDAGLLRKFSGFEKFSDADLDRLLDVAQHASTSGPWPLIHEKAFADACFILLEGEAGVYVGKERVAVVGPGEVIGESALHGQLRNATVTTTGPSEVLRIGRDDLALLLDEIPAMRETIDATVAKHTSSGD